MSCFNCKHYQREQYNTDETGYTPQSCNYVWDMFNSTDASTETEEICFELQDALFMLSKLNKCQHLNPIL